MMKMIIQLDKDKAQATGYEYDNLIKIMDALFERNFCIKETNNDESMVYSNSNLSDNHMRDFACIYMVLSESKWFADTCSKWIWLDNDDDETLPFVEEDVLIKERKRNPLFAM